MSLIGIHLDDLANIMDNEYKHIKHFQIFVDPMIDYNLKYKRHLKYISDHMIKIVVHSSYTINISKKWQPEDWWVGLIIRELEQASNIGAYSLVIHTGKKMELDQSVAINNMYSFLLHINRMSHNNVKILLETPSGQGTELLHRIEDYTQFMKKLMNISSRFGCCIDTCHLYAAGIDLRKKEQIDLLFDHINKTIGIESIKLCHLNDSKEGLGSRRDRHDTLGRGKIGFNGLEMMIRFIKKIGIPIILETPHHAILDDWKKTDQIISL